MDDSTYCKLSGKLYTFEAACKSCPKGWKLPSDTDWAALEKYLGIPDSELFLEALRGYNQSLDMREFGTTGFNAKIAGFYNKSAFYYYNLATAWWTSTMLNDSMAWCREISHKTGMGRYRDRLYMQFSVRCIREN